MLPSPSDLRYFVEVCHTLNLSRASEKLGVSQPSLSASIKRLEFRVGTLLFFRNKNGVAITQAGKRLLARTEQLLQLWESLKSESLASHTKIQGNFILGCHPTIALHVLTAFLPTLLKTYPKLEIQLKHDLSRKILEGVVNLSIDIGLVVNPIHHPDLIIKRLQNDKITFWRKTGTQTLLSSEHVVLICDPDLIQTQWLLKRVQKELPLHYRVLTSNNLEVIAHLTAQGCGIGILPTYAVNSNYADVLETLPNSPSYSDEICLVYRHENRTVKALEEIIKTIKHCVSI